MVMWIILLNSFSYPITAVVIAYLNLPSTPINIGLKSIYFILSFVVLLLVSYKQRATIPKLALGILFFYAIYSIRLVFDISVRGIIFNSPFYVYSYFLGGTLTPILAITFAYRYINIYKLTKYSFYFILLANLLILYYLFAIGENGSFQEQISSRAQINSDSNEKAGVTGTLINPILISYFGGTLVVYSLNFILNRLVPRVNKILLFACILIGFSSLLLGASRGPFIGTMLMIVLSLGITFHIRRNKAVYLLKILSVAVIMGTVLYRPITNFLSTNNVSLLIRIEQFAQSRGKNKVEYRDVAFRSAFNDFLNSPIIGERYLGTFDNFYPHNIILEAFMATGIVGGFFFAIYFAFFIRSSFVILTSRRFESMQPFTIISILCFLLGLTSGGLFSNPDIFILSTVTTLLPLNKYNFKP